MLDTPFPMLIMWGDDLVQLYNDAFVPIFLDKHPRSLGETAQECWGEIWAEVGPVLRGVFAASRVKRPRSGTRVRITCYTGEVAAIGMT